jgi:ribosomal protein S19E (S16A)
VTKRQAALLKIRYAMRMRNLGKGRGYPKTEAAERTAASMITIHRSYYLTLERDGFLAWAEPGLVLTDKGRAELATVNLETK